MEGTYGCHSTTQDLSESFDGKVEVRKVAKNTVVMIGIEEEILLKLQGTYAYAQKYAYNS